MKDGDRGPEDIVEMFPVTLAPLVLGNDHFAGATFHTLWVSVFAKLTTKQVHPQYAVKIQRGGREKECVFGHVLEELRTSGWRSFVAPSPKRGARGSKILLLNSLIRGLRCDVSIYSNVKLGETAQLAGVTNWLKTNTSLKRATQAGVKEERDKPRHAHKLYKQVLTLWFTFGRLRYRISENGDAKTMMVYFWLLSSSEHRVKQEKRKLVPIWTKKYLKHRN